MCLKINSKLGIRAAVILLLSFLLLIHTPILGRAQTDSGVRLTASLGFDGTCKVEHWLPIKILFENFGGGIQGKIEVTTADQGSNHIFETPVTLPNISRKEVTIYFYSQKTFNDLQIRLVENSTIINETDLSISCTQANDTIFGIIAANPTFYNILTNLDPPNGKASIAQIQISDIPENQQGLEALDYLVFSNIDTGTLSEAQKQAITQWVFNGGRLVVTGGTGWQKTAAGLGEIIPFEPQDVLSISDLSSLQDLTRSENKFSEEIILAQGEIKNDAEIVVSQTNRIPFIIRKNLGFGESYYFTFDPSIAPLRNWDGLEDLYRFLFSSTLDHPSWANGFSHWTSAEDAVVNIPGLGLPSTAIVCGFVSLYVIAIGPINYLILSRRKRRELAWITVPIIVLLFSLAAFLIGNFLRGNRPVINQLSIVQIWNESEAAKVDGLLGLFSPTRETYQLDVKGNFLAHPLPQNQFAREEITIQQKSNGLTIPGLKLNVGGITSFVVEGEISSPRFPAQLELRFNNATANLEGSIVNNSETTLKDVILLSPGATRKLDDLPPGKELNIQLPISLSQTSNTPSINFSPLGDSTIEDILGPRYLQGNQNDTLSQRFNLLEAALGPNGTRGGGIFLTGWSDTSPLNIDIQNNRFTTRQTTLYIIHLNPKVSRFDSPVQIPPHFLSRTILEQPQSGRPFSPSRLPLEPNESISFLYQLNQSIPFESVVSLILHLQSYGNTNLSELIVLLWDFRLKDWVELPPINWGDNEIVQPNRYVSPDGEIRMRLLNNSQNSPLEIETANFTLIVQ